MVLKSWLEWIDLSQWQSQISPISWMKYNYIHIIHKSKWSWIIVLQKLKDGGSELTEKKWVFVSKYIRKLPTKKIISLDASLAVWFINIVTRYLRKLGKWWLNFLKNAILVCSYSVSIWKISWCHLKTVPSE